MGYYHHYSEALCVNLLNTIKVSKLQELISEELARGWHYTTQHIHMYPHTHNIPHTHVWTIHSWVVVILMPSRGYHPPPSPSVKKRLLVSYPPSPFHPFIWQPRGEEKPTSSLLTKKHKDTPRGWQYDWQLLHQVSTMYVWGSSTTSCCTHCSVLVTPHVSMVNPHVSMVNPHVSMVNPHVSMVNPHVSMVNPHVSMVNPHVSMVNPHVSMINSHNSHVSIVTIPMVTCILTLREQWWLHIRRNDSACERWWMIPSVPTLRPRIIKTALCKYAPSKCCH